MPKAIRPRTLLLSLSLGLLLSFVAYWWAWSRGFVIASADGRAGSRYVIREVPHATGLVTMLFGLTDYSYRMEYWRWSHFIHDCRSFAGDSYRAQSARIELSPERCIFYLDDTPNVTLIGSEWTH